jgi:hypothetical protein
LAVLRQTAIFQNRNRNLPYQPYKVYYPHYNSRLTGRARVGWHGDIGLLR